MKTLRVSSRKTRRVAYRLVQGKHVGNEWMTLKSLHDDQSRLHSSITRFQVDNDRFL